MKSVAVDVVVVVELEGDVAHVEDVFVDVVAVSAVDECLVVEKKMTDDVKNVAVVKVVVLLMNQKIIQPMDQMVISFGEISYYVASVAVGAAEGFVHQS